VPPPITRKSKDFLAKSEAVVLGLIILRPMDRGWVNFRYNMRAGMKQENTKSLADPLIARIHVLGRKDPGRLTGKYKGLVQ
jgi:hypothetical protein